jgi:LPS export ABC transporter protein LptC
MLSRSIERRTRAAVLASAAAAASAAGCKDQRNPTLTARAVIPDSAEQVMYGLRHALTSDGVRRGELFADTAYFYDANSRIELRGVRTTFFTANGDSNAVLTGREATYRVQEQRIEGRGDVKVVANDGRRLTSPRLVYDRGINQISSDTAFTFAQPGRTVSGVGFRADPGLRNVQVLSNFKGRSGVSGGRP